MKISRIAGVLLIFVVLLFAVTASASTIVLPDELKRIESEAFIDVHVDYIEFPYGIEYIAEDAFEKASFIGIGPPDIYAEEWCLSHGFEYNPYPTNVDDFTWEELNGSQIVITKYNGTDEKVCIPSEIEGYEVVEIGKAAFMGNETMTAVYFPDTLQKIGESAFQGCTALRRVDFPESLTYMGWRAFRECTSLVHFGYPVNVEEVGGTFLYGCTSLKEVTVPEGVYRVMDYFVRNAGSIEVVNLPSTLEEIGKYSFAGNNKFTKLDIPDSVEIIDEYAFSECVNMTSIDFPDSLARIEQYAFAKCTGLQSIDLPPSLVYLGYCSFDKCTSLTHFGYPVGIEEVGGVYLGGAESLTEITVPEGVTWLMDYFVSYAGAVTTINLPSTLEKIGKYAFANTNVFTTVNIPEGVKEIDEYAFYNNSKLVSIDIPASVQTIGNKCFEKCTGLKTITFHEGLEKVGMASFKSCTALKTVELPDSVTSIGAEAFRGCSTLSSFRYPLKWTGSVQPGAMNTKYERGRVFEGCKMLKSITIPEGVEALPYMAFSFASYLQTVQLPSTLKTINHGTFWGATGLRNINFPDGLTKIGYGAFMECTALKEANLPDSVTTIGSSAFKNCTSLAAIHFPKNWTTVVSPSAYDSYDSVMFSKGYIFGGCTKLTSVVITDGATCIPGYAFENCTKLASVTIPSSVKVIGERAFNGCSVLKKVYLGYPVEEIGKNAFKGCSVLTIHTEYGAYALTYAIENGISYYYLSLTDASVPQGTLYQGEHFPLYGFVRSSVPVESVTATIWNADQSQALQTVTFNPGETDYDLSGYINSHLYVENLPLGTYWFSITAAAGEETETYGSWKFTTVPAPLRVTGKMYLPKDIVDPSQKLSGYVTANYTITKMVITVSKPSGHAVISKMYTPNSKTFDLSTAAADFDLGTLPLEEYVMTLTMTAKDETHVIGKTYFTVASYDGVVDQKTFDAVVNFVKDGSNRSIFSKYGYRISDVTAEMDIDTAFTLAITDYKGIAWNKFKDWVMDNNYDTYLVKLYKVEIVELLKDLTNQGSMDSVDTELVSSIVKALQKYGSLTTGYVKEFYGKQIKEDVKALIDELNGMIDVLDYSLDAIKQFDELMEMIEFIVSDYTAELAILDMVEELTADRTDEDFARAMLEVRREFRAKWFTVLYNSWNAALEECVDGAITKAVKAMIKTLGGSSTGYSVLTFALDKSLEYSGLNEEAANLKTFFAQQTSAYNADDAYSAMFSVIEAGETSSENIQKFISTFIYARQAYYRIYATMEDMTNNYEEENEIWMDRMDISLLVIPGMDMSGIID